MGKIKDKIKKTIKVVSSPVKNVSSFAAWAPLLPFQPIMKGILNKKGKPVGKNIEETSLNFYNYIIKGNNYEIKHLEPATIAAIITAIINFLTGLKKEADKTGTDLPVYNENENENKNDNTMLYILGVIAIVILFSTFKK